MTSTGLKCRTKERTEQSTPVVLMVLTQGGEEATFKDVM